MVAHEVEDKIDTVSIDTKAIHEQIEAQGTSKVVDAKSKNDMYLNLPPGNNKRALKH